MKQNKRVSRIMVYIVSIVGVLIIGTLLFMNQPSFGKHPTGERLERIKRSKNYRDGEFKNLRPTTLISSDKSRLEIMLNFLLSAPKNIRPEEEIKAKRTNLYQLPNDQDLLVWFGHSSFYYQVGGKKVLIDPVFCGASPVSFVNKPFKGTDIYKPEDMPSIDYMIITHDHWDHLDYETVVRLRSKVKKVVCPLGVGAHLEHWGVASDSIIEMDWNEQADLGEGFSIHCLPARHFSGRGLKSNQTLWASFLFISPEKKIYVSGDGGYDAHFKEIGKKYDIDLAIMENGQYGADWAQIHIVPEKLGQAASEIGAKRVITGHHSKYALAQHTWDAPLQNEQKAANEYSFNLVTTTIGEIVEL